MSRTALLLIDIQQSFYQRGYIASAETAAFEQKIQQLIVGCQQRDILLVDVFHTAPQKRVVYFRRSGDDPQLSPWLCHRNHLNPVIHRAQDLLIQHPEKRWQLEEIAGRVHVSARHLTRLFRQHLAISVRDYQEQLRLAVAHQRISQGESAERAALAAGFSSARQLRRAEMRWQERVS